MSERRNKFIGQIVLILVVIYIELAASSRVVKKLRSFVFLPLTKHRLNKLFRQQTKFNPEYFTLSRPLFIKFFLFRYKINIKCLNPWQKFQVEAFCLFKKPSSVLCNFCESVYRNIFAWHNEGHEGIKERKLELYEKMPEIFLGSF